MASGRRPRFVHPFERWVRGRHLIARFVAFSFTFSTLRFIDTRLSAASGKDQADLAWAGDASKAAEAIDAWRTAHVEHLMGFAVGWDYLHMVVYAVTLAAFCAIVARSARNRGYDRLARIGVVAGYVAFGAALFNAADQLLTIVSLGSAEPRLAPWITRISVVHFSFIGLSLLYVLVTAPFLGLRRAVRSNPSRETAG